MEIRMKKNEEKATILEKNKLIWKLAERPSGHVIAELVANGVIDVDEARDILFREEAKQSDEVEALKEMVKTLQGMVASLLARRDDRHYVPYTRIIEVPAPSRPYWTQYWDSARMTSGATSSSLGTVTTAGTDGSAVYKLSI